MPERSGAVDEIGEFRRRERAGVEGRRTQEVRVAVRGARDLPQPEVLAVVLTGREVRERAEHIGLALHDEHGHARVGADVVAAREPRAAGVGVVRVEVTQIPTSERHARTGPSLQQVRVEDCCHADRSR